jgi:hypothetical protein
LPGGEEITFPTVVHPGKLIEVRRACPTGVLKTLSKLSPIHVSLYLDNDDASIVIERHYVGATPRNHRLPRHKKERLPSELLEVVPKEILDLALI